MGKKSSPEKTKSRADRERPGHPPADGTPEDPPAGRVYDISPDSESAACEQSETTDADAPGVLSSTPAPESPPGGGEPAASPASRTPAESPDGAPVDADGPPGDADAPVPGHPRPREVLERLLEKNEIILKLNRENAEQQERLKELNDRWMRSVAEFENYRKRSRKEWELLKQQSKVEVVLDVLGVVDDFERAFSVVSGDEPGEFVQGIRLIFNGLAQSLERHDVHEIPCDEQPFDPALHMAVGQIETDDVPSGHIAETVQKGYRLGDAVIRPARVIVAK